MKGSWRWLLLIVAVALVAYVCYDYYSVAGRFSADAKLWSASVKSSLASDARYAYTQMTQARMRLTGGLVGAGICVSGFLWLQVRKAT